MSIALYVLIFIIVVSLVWRSFMKYKEQALDIAHGIAKKQNISILDETVCLRKIKFSFDDRRICVYRVYSFDYNIMESFERYRGYIVLKNSMLSEVVLSKTDMVDVTSDNTARNNVYKEESRSNNIISFDE